MANMADKSGKSNEWYTPDWILNKVRDYFGGAIPLDPATTSSNRTMAAKYYTKDVDGLAQDWSGDGVFVNPPHSIGEGVTGNVQRLMQEYRQRQGVKKVRAPIMLWLEKIENEAAKTPILALLSTSARTETVYWQRHVFSSRLAAVCYLLGSVAFIDEQEKPQENGTQSHAIYGFGHIDLVKFHRTFSPLGRVMYPSFSPPAAVPSGDRANFWLGRASA